MEKTLSARDSRPSTGRVRNEQARRDILEAALALAQQGELAALTVEQIASQARVGKQTIYRWWPSKWAVILDALLDRGDHEVHRAGDGTRVDEVVGFLTSSFAAISREGGAGPVLKALMAHAQLDPEFAAVWRERFILPRRAALARLLTTAGDSERAPSSLDTEATVDLLFGAMWYRLLIGHAPLDEAYARQLAEAVT